MSQYPVLYAGQRFTAATASSMLPLEALKSATTDRASTTTVTADPELVLAVEANAEYIFEFYWRIGGAAAGGVDITVTTPSGGSGSYGHTRLAAVQVDTGTRTSSRVSMNVETEYSTPSPTVHQVFNGGGRLYTGASAGDFSIDWAQNVSNATATSFHADSWIRLKRVA